MTGMNKLKYLFLSLTAIIGLTLSSCSDDGDDIDNSQSLFFKPSLNWGCTKSQIFSSMTDYTLLAGDEQTLCYKAQDETVAYGFKNDRLNTVVVIPDASLSLDDILLAFSGYKLLSQYKNYVYLNERTNTIAEIENGDGYYTISWSQYGLDVANAVDLGLSVKWADVNVDMGYDDNAALTPENPQDDDSRMLECLIGWGDPTGVNRSTLDSSYPQVNSISGTSYDVATVKWGKRWRIPTQSEYQELLSDCSWVWEERNGSYGYKVTGPNGNSIFLPTTGFRDGSSYYKDESGLYWAATMAEDSYPYFLLLDDSIKELRSMYKHKGYAIRPVQDK